MDARKAFYKRVREAGLDFFDAVTKLSGHVRPKVLYVNYEL